MQMLFPRSVLARLVPSRGILVWHGIIALALVALMVSPERGEAQGWRDKLKKAAVERAGLGDAAEAVDAVKAGRALKNAMATMDTPTPLAGTYRVTYVSGADTATFVVRTFEKPFMPIVKNNNAWLEGSGEKLDYGLGYVLMGASAREESQLPESARDTAKVQGMAMLTIIPLQADEGASERRYRGQFLPQLKEGVDPAYDRVWGPFAALQEARMVGEDESNGGKLDVEFPALITATSDGAVTVRQELSVGGRTLLVTAERVSTASYRR